MLGVDFVDQTMESAIEELARAACAEDEVRSVVFPNAATLNLASEDPTYRDVLNSMDFVYADGTGVRWAARMRGVTLQANLNGTDVIPALLASAGALRVYLLGSTEDVNQAAAQAIARDYPDVDVVGRQHGFFDHDNPADVIADIRRAAPQVLLVGFGNPLQERWIAENRAALTVPLIAGVGGLFGFWAGTRTRASGVTRSLGMEWVDILVREPHKARRYLAGNPRFLARAARMRRRDLAG